MLMASSPLGVLGYAIPQILRGLRRFSCHAFTNLVNFAVYGRSPRRALSWPSLWIASLACSAISAVSAISALIALLGLRAWPAPSLCGSTCVRPGGRKRQTNRIGQTRIHVKTCSCKHLSFGSELRPRDPVKDVRAKWMPFGDYEALEVVGRRPRHAQTPEHGRNAGR